jgi:dolichol-phosphate mannosyltransferase
MDCDFSHSPKAIREFISVKDIAAVVVGTRFVPEGLKEWGLYRTLQSYAAHALTRLMLGMPYDASGGFRLYNLEEIPKNLFSKVKYNNYSFFWESLHLIWINGYKIHQVPITLTGRSFGTSKMKVRDVITGFSQLIATFLRKLLHRESFLTKPPANVD